MKMLKNFHNHLSAQMLKHIWHWHWHYLTAALFYFGAVATSAVPLTNLKAVIPTVLSPPSSLIQTPKPASQQQLSTTKSLTALSSSSSSSSSSLSSSPSSSLTPLLSATSLTDTYAAQYLNNSSSSLSSSLTLMANSLKQTSAATTATLTSGHTSFYVMDDEPSLAAPPAVAALTANTFISSSSSSSLLLLSSSSSSSSTFIEPYLDGFASTNITAQIGTHAYLPCRVKQVGNKSISWIRVRDGHILTVDRAVFIADQRFLALKQPNKFWTLQIKYVQARDAGAYECQVSTEPKVSARVHLQVVVPRTEILGDPDRYVKAGSTVILRCIVRGALEPPTFIMWYHGIDQLTADSKRHKITLERNLPEIEGDAHSTIGSLIIESAKKRDTGNYTCNPSNSPSVTVTLNVINGESSASAVTSSASVTRKFYSTYSHALIFSLIIIVGHKT